MKSVTHSFGDGVTGPMGMRPDQDAPSSPHHLKRFFEAHVLGHAADISDRHYMVKGTLLVLSVLTAPLLAALRRGWAGLRRRSGSAGQVSERSAPPGGR